MYIQKLRVTVITRENRGHELLIGNKSGYGRFDITISVNMLRYTDFHKKYIYTYISVLQSLSTLY